MKESNWQLQEAKARFSELVKIAQQQGPQQITVHGKPAAVLLSRRDYDRLNKDKSTFVAFMKRSPLSGLDIQIERDKSPIRNIEL